MGKDVTTGTTPITLHLFGEIKKAPKVVSPWGLRRSPLRDLAAAGHLLGLGVCHALLFGLGFCHGFGACLLGGELLLLRFGVRDCAVGGLLVGSHVVRHSLHARRLVEAAEVVREVLRCLGLEQAGRIDPAVVGLGEITTVDVQLREVSHFLVRAVELGVGQLGLCGCSVRGCLLGKLARLLDADVLGAADEHDGHGDEHHAHQGFQGLVHFGPPKAV
jgi:hypothetical protein